MKDAPMDSIGKPVPGCEIKIDSKTEEILMKSPYMMKGYYKDQEMTDKVLKDGWLHSGDKGTIDKDGFVRVIGRVSDAFKTSKGKFITPNPIEEKIEKNDLIEQVCIAGLGNPQPMAMVNLSELAQEMTKEEIEESLLNTLTELNKDLANYERVSTIIIDSKTWNTENALLTPTLKVRRGEIDKQFRANFLNWHESKNQILWL